MTTQPNAPEATLLVVDDEPSIRELLSASLRFAGFKVLAAADGHEALDHQAGARIDLTVLDVMLPDMDGFEVLRRLRERDRSRRRRGDRPRQTHTFGTWARPGRLT